MAKKNKMSPEKSKRHAETLWNKLVKKIDTEGTLAFGSQTAEARKNSGSIKKIAEEMLEKGNEEEKQKSRLKQYLEENRIPEPPIINLNEESSELIEFIETNEIDFTSNSLFEAVSTLISSDELPYFPIRIDKDKELIFSPDESIIGIKAELKDSTGNINLIFDSNKDNINDFLATIQGYVNNAKRTSETKEEKSFIVWPYTYVNIDDEEEKIKCINKIYEDMVKSDLYDENQLELFYRLMYCDYDINCFSSPLYTYEQIEILILIYENNESPEFENFLRNFNEFCTQNFNYKFTETEFMMLYEAAHNNKLQELISDPDFEAKFNLLHHFDISKNTEKDSRIQIGDLTFIARTDFNVINGLMSISNQLFIETIDSKGTINETKIYESKNGKQEGDLSAYINAYNKKHNVKDSSIIMNIYMEEFRKSLKTEKDPKPKIIELNNGHHLEISKISYPKSDKIKDTSYAIGCKVELVTEKGKKVLYSDDPHVSLGLFQLLKSVINKAGGIKKEDRVLKKQSEYETSDIEKQVLSGTSDSRTISSNIIKEKLELTRKTGVKQEISLKNGETIVFQSKEFFTNNKLQTMPVAFLLDINGKEKERFIDVKTIPNKKGILVAQFKENLIGLVDYFEQVEFGRATNTAIEILKNANKQKNNEQIK